MHQPFVYIWRHKPSMKWYIGSRTAKKCHPEDGYICSSKIIKPMIKANPHEWEREILKTGTREEMLAYEFELLDVFDAKNDHRSFNLHNGDGKFSMSGQVGARVGSIPWNKGLTKHDDIRIANVAEYNSIHFKGKTPANKGQVGHPAWNKGLTKDTDERVAKNVENFSQAQKGKIPWNKGLTKETSESIARGTEKSAKANIGKTPWNKGLIGVIKQSPESNAKRSGTLKGRPCPEEVKQKIRDTKRLRQEAKLNEQSNKGNDIGENNS